MPHQITKGRMHHVVTIPGPNGAYDPLGLHVAQTTEVIEHMQQKHGNPGEHGHTDQDAIKSEFLIKPF